MKGIYLCAGFAKHINYDIIYQDKYVKRDLGGDMLDVELSNYDYIIATPPCNYYSRANYRRETSKYSQETKHLLPEIIKKCILLNKPFIVENVRNKKLFKENGIYYETINTYYIGRHTYFTNINFTNDEINYLNFLQIKDFSGKKGYTTRLHSYTEGGFNVKIVIDKFLEKIKA